MLDFRAESGVFDHLGNLASGLDAGLHVGRLFRLFGDVAEQQPGVFAWRLHLGVDGGQVGLGANEELDPLRGLLLDG